MYVNKHLPKAVLASLIGLLVACGSDNDTTPAPDPTVPENTAPVADIAQVNIGETISIDVLANDTDTDGDTLQITSASAVSGSVTVVSNKLSYVAGQAAGVVAVTYGISDGKGGTAQSSVAVTVVTKADAVNAYIGTMACLACHQNKYAYLETGHNFKLNKM